MRRGAVRWVLIFGAVVFLLAISHRASPAQIPLREGLPDPVATADSASAIVIARCAESSFPENGDARFSLLANLAGHASLRFVVRSNEHGVNLYRKGDRYALFLDEPQARPRGTRTEAAETSYAASRMPGISEIPLDESEGRRAEERARSLAALRGASEPARPALLAGGAQSADVYVYAYALQGLLLHPDLYSVGAESTVVSRLRAFTWPWTWAARLLGEHPSARTRSLRAEWSDLGSDQRAMAIMLAAHDSLPSERRWLVSRQGETDSGVLHELVAALDPSRSDERAALVSIARSADASGWYVSREVFQRLGSEGPDEAWLFVADRIRHPAGARISWYPVMPPGEAFGWNDSLLVANLSNANRFKREEAIREVGRRRNRVGLTAIRARLEENHLPDGSEVSVYEAQEMIESLGAARDSTAVPQLIRFTSIQDPQVRATLARALGRIGDRRAVPALRRMADSAGCPEDRSFSGVIESQVVENLVMAFAELELEEEAPRIATWARHCPGARAICLAAFGRLRGSEQTIGLLRQILGPSPQLDEILRYANLGAWFASGSNSP